MVKKLITIVRRNEPLRRFFETTLNGPIDESDPKYGQHGFIDEYDVEDLEGRFVDLARELEQAGAGRFVVGRRKHPSRLEWSRDIREIAQEALGNAAKSNGSDPGQGEHTINLPRGRAARLTLPAELTGEEADVVIAYLRAIVPRAT